MRVNTSELQEGCILLEDVFVLTNRPIMEKRTVLTKELINVLHTFLVKTVEIDKMLVTGVPFIPVENDEMDSISTQEPISFTKQFLQTVRVYKREFQAWQSGMPIDIAKIRLSLLPLLETSLMEPAEIFSMHHFSINDEYLYQHCIAVGLLSGFIAKKLNYSKGEVIQAALGGCLADCGMAKVSPGILSKKKALNAEEFEEIKNHPTFSYKMVQHLPLLKEEAKIAIFQHHERLDGSGYPFSHRNANIHPIAKIIAVADTFHAMTSERLYRSKQSPFKVYELMLQDYFGKFDIAAIKALGSGLIIFSIGSKVKLSDGQTGEILFITEKSPTRPLIKISNTDKILNLEENRHLFIEEVMMNN